MLLSALLYHRAVKIQRFLEPALALSQPRSRLAEDINTLITKEFGTEEPRPVKFVMGSIYVNEALLFDRTGRFLESSPTTVTTIKKLSTVFLQLMEDERIHPYIDLVVVCGRFPLFPDRDVNRKLRLMQIRSDLVLNAMFRAEPRLEQLYSPYFAAATIPVDSSIKRVDVLEFRIIPSEQLHIDVLQRLRKYVL